jgi:nicotinamidase-related amidase
MALTTLANIPPDSALLLIDLQQDFLSDSGKMPVARGHVAPLLTATRAAMARFQAERRPIVAIGNEFRRTDFVMNVLRRNAAIEGSPGAAWDARIPFGDAKYFPKWGGDSFGNPKLEPWLREKNIKTLVICGLMARACVTATVKSALKRGFSVYLIDDGVACKSDASKTRSLSRLHERGAASLSV